MFWTELLITLIIAALLAAIFVPLLGWRRLGATPEGMGAAFIFFFVIVFLAALVGGMWLEPVGPRVWGVAWLGIFTIALVVSLLIAAVAPPPGRRGRVRAPGDTRSVTESAVVLGAGVFFWTLTVILVLAAAASYTECGRDGDTTEGPIIE